MSDVDVTWIDHGREPKCAPDPRYPDGIDIDATLGHAVPSCRVELQHPTPRCGAYSVHCKVCGLIVLITTAGRPDDPRSVKLPCRRRE